MNPLTDAIFTSGDWLIIFPAAVVGLCIWSLIFLTIERKVIHGPIWYTFIIRDLLWIIAAVRQVFILDQTDVFESVVLFLIACLFAAATVITYQGQRKRIDLRAVNGKKEAEIEAAYHGSARERSV